jgi:spore maturation protein CgeB
MRVLIVHPGPLPDFSVHDVAVGWCEGLRELGCDAQIYNLNDRLIFYSNALIDTGEKDETGLPVVRNAMSQEQVFMAALQGISHALLTFWPDVVLMISGFYMTAAYMQLMRSRNFRTVMHFTESPYQDNEQLPRAAFADLALLNDPANLEAFRDVTAAEYMPHAFRPSVHYPRSGPRDPELASDLCFIGTAFASRIAFFEQMDLSGLDVLLAGNDWGKLDPASPAARYVGTPLGEPDCIDNPQAAELYRHAKAGLNFYRREGTEDWDGQGWACGPREIELAATGLPFLRDPRPESDELFGKILPSFSGPGDASEKLRWLLSHDAEREEMAAKARLAVADRTFENNAKRLLGLIEKL